MTLWLFFFFLASTSVLGLVFWPSINCTIHLIWIFLSWFCSFPPLFHQVTHQSLCTNSASVCRKPCPPELWSVTMVFVSSSSNAIITLNSYSVKSPSTYPFTFGFKCCCVCGVWVFFFFCFFFLNFNPLIKSVVQTVKQDCISAVPMTLCTLHQGRRWK